MSDSQGGDLTHLKVGEGLMELPLIPGGMVIGSGPESQLRLDDSSLQQRHARVVRLDGAWWLEPLASGVRLNGQTVRGLSVLHPGDQVQVGQTVLTLIGQSAPGLVRIGRSPECELVLDSPLVSRFHAELEGSRLRDLGSANGTFVDGRRIDQADLEARQMVYIGPSRLLFEGGRLKEFGTRGEVRVQALDLGYQPPGSDRRILQGVTACAKPGQFVALVGTSGAGKSTMLSLLSGQRPPSAGHVLYNGLEASRNMGLFRPLIGYVPQDDIVHRELPVEAALGYSARPRLPADTTPEEIQRRLDFVLASMELSDRRHNPIHTLSGGQRKRVSIAVELLTEPSLFFLDEPTSGLDPGLEKKAMQLLAGLAQQGRTVILITHATQNIVLCDRVLFLARGGRMVWFGPPRRALEYFEVEDFADIYLKIGTSELGLAWEERFLKSREYQEFVEQDRSAPPEPPRPGSPTSRPPHDWLLGLRQFPVLLERYAHLVISDRFNLALLVGQAPVIGAILALLFDPNLFALNQEWGHGKYPIKEGPTLLFLLMVSCLFFGSINACREVVKELPIFRRERLVNLRLLPYLLSKVLVQAGLGVMQTALLMGVVMLRIDLHLDGPGLLEVYGFLLIVQLALSGAFIKPEEMLAPVRVLSVVSLSRWSFAGIGTVADLNSRFEELGMGWITCDFYLTPAAVWSVLLPLLALHLVLVVAALRWRESRLA